MVVSTPTPCTPRSIESDIDERARRHDRLPRPIWKSTRYCLRFPDWWHPEKRTSQQPVILAESASFHTCPRDEKHVHPQPVIHGLQGPSRGADRGLRRGSVIANCTVPGNVRTPLGPDRPMHRAEGRIRAQPLSGAHFKNTKHDKRSSMSGAGSCPLGITRRPRRF